MCVCVWGSRQCGGHCSGQSELGQHSQPVGGFTADTHFTTSSDSKAVTSSPSSHRETWDNGIIGMETPKSETTPAVISPPCLDVGKWDNGIMGTELIECHSFMYLTWGII